MSCTPNCYKPSKIKASRDAPMIYEYYNNKYLT